MVEKTVIVDTPHAQKATPAALLVQLASQYQSQIHLVTGQAKVNAKSIMGMMAISLVPGDFVTITASGADEETAVSEIGNFLTNA